MWQKKDRLGINNMSQSWPLSDPEQVTSFFHVTGHRVIPLPCAQGSLDLRSCLSTISSSIPLHFQKCPIWMIPYIITIAMTPKDFSLSHQQNKGC